MINFHQQGHTYSNKVVSSNSATPYVDHFLSNTTVSLIKFFLNSWANSVLFRKPFSIPMSSRILSIISYSSFIILSFKIRLLMHLQCDRCMYNSIYFFLHLDVKLPWKHLWKMLSFAYCMIFVSLLNIERL